MSDPTEPASPPPVVPPAPTLADRVMEWSRPVIAVFSLAIFALAFWIAWGLARGDAKDTKMLDILVGAIVSLVSTISGYYFGSSVGSQKKDDVIHAALETAQERALPPAPPRPPGP